MRMKQRLFSNMTMIYLFTFSVTLSYLLLRMHEVPLIFLLAFYMAIMFFCGHVEKKRYSATHYICIFRNGTTVSVRVEESSERVIQIFSYLFQTQCFAFFSNVMFIIKKRNNLDDYP